MTFDHYTLIYNLIILVAIAVTSVSLSRNASGRDAARAGITASRSSLDDYSDVVRGL